MDATPADQSAKLLDKASAVLVRVNRLIGILGSIALPLMALRGWPTCSWCDHPIALDEIPVFNSLLQGKISSARSLCLYEIACGLILLFRLGYIGVFHNYIIDANIERFKKKGRVPVQSFKIMIYMYLIVLAVAAPMSFASLDVFDPLSEIKFAFYSLVMFYVFIYVTPEILLYVRTVLRLSSQQK
jgi:hypothetical protein